MREGALGVGSSLIYAPASYAKTDELIALSKAAGEFGGGYISHMRSEGDRFLEALDELIRIAREAKVHAQVYHLKAAGEKQLAEDEQAIDEDRSGAQGRAARSPPTCTATRPARPGSTRRCRPGCRKAARRVDRAAEAAGRPQARHRRRCASRTRAGKACCYAAGSPERVLLIGFKNDKLKPLTGKTLAEVAKMRGVSPEDAAIDLVIEDQLARRHGVLPDVRGQREARPVAAVGEHRLGCGGAGAGRPVPAEQSASARLRHVSRASSAATCATRR